ncbi:hypothetical protein BRADI_4g22653v3 [Brachypodium distachyon]|uniref:Uncharacterized protein n=1 Tax=Brachypodium distachyon TaxID=15368 RepID=I1IMM9_BRADI|nr:hypothetical protein BRADI_4g22653v3 [Brachypodium distachyon]
MVLGMNCFGSHGAAGRKISPASKQLGAEVQDQKVVIQEEASAEAKREGGDQVKVGEKEEGKKSGAPILMYHFPFHSRPGLL